jgi:copper(I)-binding protein
MPVRALCSLLILMAAAASPAAAQNAIQVTDAWIMTPPPNASEASAYLSVRSASSDRLLSVSCDCSARAELHDMQVVNGVMEMRQLRYGIAVDAGGTIRLDPRGAHIMLIGLSGALEEGADVTLRLTFEDAGVVVAQARVRPIEARRQHQH